MLLGIMLVGMIESSNVSRDNVSREIGRSSPVGAKLPNSRSAARP